MKTFTKISLSLTLGLTMAMLNSLSSFAESADNLANPDTGYQNSETGSTSTNDFFNPFDLIHNVNLNRGNFNLDAANENIDEEASNFKAIQQQRLLEMLNHTQHSPENTQIEETIED